MTGVQDPIGPAPNPLAGIFDNLNPQDPQRQGQQSLLGDWGDSVQRAKREAYGLDWWGQMGIRAARGLGDAELATVDTASRGFAKIGQWAQYLTGHDPSIEAKGVVERLTGQVDPDTLDALHSVGFLDDPQGARVSAQEKLGNSEVAASVFGNILSFVNPVGPSNIVGRGGQVAAELPAKLAVTIAGPIRRAAERLVREGKWTADQVKEWTKTGKLMQKVGEAGSWGERTMAGVSRYAGEYGSLLSQSYATTPQSHQQETLDDMKLWGLAYPAVTRVAKAVNQRLLDKMTTNSEREALLILEDALAGGDTSKLAFALKHPAIAGKGLVANALQAAIETVGFTAAQPQQLQTLIKAFGGDAKAQGELLPMMLGTGAGIMSTKLGLPMAQVPYWKRLRPDLNTYKTMVEQEQAQAAEQHQQRQQQQVEGDKALLEAHQMEGEQGKMAESEYARAYGEQEPQTPDRAALAAEPFMDAAVTPLLRSGWQPSEVVSGANPSVRLDMPGATIRIRHSADGGVQVEVPKETWKHMRPDADLAGGDTDQTLTGNGAKSFITDLGIHGTAQMARSAMRFGGGGFYDTGNGSWRSKVTGTEYQFGLDGRLYSRDPLQSQKWSTPSNADRVLYEMTMPSSENSYWDGALESWSNFLREKQRVASEPIVDDAIGMAIMLAQHGGSTPQAQGMRQLLGSLDPKMFAQALRPDNSRAMAHSLLSVGAGMSTPEMAGEMLSRAAQAPQKAAESEFTNRLLLGLPESMIGELYSPEAAYVPVVPRRTEGGPPAEPQPEQDFVPGMRGPIPTAEKPAKEVKGKYTRDDAVREFRATEAATVDKPVTVKVSSGEARSAALLFPRKSAAYKALKALEKTGGSVELSPEDLQHMAENHARWAPKLRAARGEAFVQPQIQTVDSMLKKALAAAGKRTEPPAGARTGEAGVGLDWVSELGGILRRGVKDFVEELGPELRRSWRDVAPESKAVIVKRARQVAQEDRDNHELGLDDLHGQVQNPSERTSEAGVRLAPTRKELRDAGGRFARGTDTVLETMPGEVSKYGGETGQRFGEDIRRGSDLYREQHGAFEQMGLHETLQRARGRKGFRDAVAWLEKPIEVRGHKISRASMLLNGKDIGEAVPAKAQQLLDEAHALRVKTGEFAEKAGTYYKKSSQRIKQEQTDYEQAAAAAEAAGQPAPERPSAYAKRTSNPNVRIMPRVNLTSDYFGAFEHPHSARNEEILRNLAELNGIKDVDAWIKDLKEQSLSPVSKDSPERTSALEHAREFDYVPDTMRLKSGEEVALQEGRLHDTILKMVERAARATAGVEAFGQDLPQGFRESVDYKKPGPTKMMQEMEVASGGDPRAMRALRAGIESLEGTKADEALLPGPIGLALKELNQTRRAMMLSGAFIPNMSEFAGSVPAFAGHANTIKGLLRTIASPRKVIGEALRMGAVLRDNMTLDNLQKYGLLKTTRKTVTSLFRASQRFTEGVAFDAAQRMANDMQSGNGSALGRAIDAEILRGLYFTPEQIAQFLSGNATPEMNRTYIRRAMAETVGSETPSERGRLANNKVFNAFFDFQRWYMKRARVTAKLVGQTARAMGSGNTLRSTAAWSRLLSFFGGSTAAGLASTMLGTIWREWSFKEGWDQFKREWDESGGFNYAIKKGLAATLFGGVARTTFEALFNESRTPAEAVASATGPGRVAVQGLDFLRSEGAYRDQNFGEKLVTLASRTPTILKDMDGLTSALGLAHDTNLNESLSALYAWKRDAGLPTPAAEPTPDADLPFVRAMRKMTAVVRGNLEKTPTEIMATPEFKKVLTEALGISEGEDIAKSLQQRRVLEDLSPEQLDALWKRAGKEKMQSLFQHDQALKMIAKSVGEAGGGTPRRDVPAVEQRLLAAEKSAEAGGSQVWKPIFAEAMDQAVGRLKVGQPSFDDLFAVADHMSKHPDQVADVLSDKQEEVAAVLGQPQLALYLRRVFIQSAIDRTKTQLRDEAKRQLR